MTLQCLWMNDHDISTPVPFFPLCPSIFTLKRSLCLRARTRPLLRANACCPCHARLIAFLLNAPRAGLQPELNAFFDHALQAGLMVPPTKSALCQARRQLSPEAVRALLGFSARSVIEHSDVPRWHGLRVLALDSTVLRVPAVPESVEFFGGMGCRGMF